MANIRAAYAEVTADYLTNGNKSATATAAAKQKQSGWQNTEFGKIYTRVNGTEKSIPVSAKTSGNYTIKIDKDGNVSVN